MAAASKHFSDSKNGGYEVALTAARAWRDAQMAALDIAERACDGNGHFLAYKRNRSGKIGLRLMPDRHPDRRIRRVYWEARFMVDGKQRIQTYTVRKYGYIGAWRLAATERSRHDGQPVPAAPPKAPDWLNEMEPGTE